MEADTLPGRKSCCGSTNPSSQRIPHPHSDLAKGRKEKETSALASVAGDPNAPAHVGGTPKVVAAARARIQPHCTRDVHARRDKEKTKDRGNHTDGKGPRAPFPPTDEARTKNLRGEGRGPTAVQ